MLARQVHGSRVVSLDGAPGEDPAAAGARPPAREAGGRAADAGEGGSGPTFHCPGAADGLVTSRPGVLLAVTAADCVPVFLAAPSGALGLLHAGWRGVAAGVLEEGVETLRRTGKADARELLVHLGPAICGSCYEVGPEVPAALGLRADGPEESAVWRRHGSLRVDLRRALADRARALDVPEEGITRSPWCTRCASDRFHSHRGRGNTAGRMAAFLGRRDVPSG